MKLEFENKEELRKYLTDLFWKRENLWGLFDKYIDELKLVYGCVDTLPEAAFYPGSTVRDKKELIEEMKSNLEFRFIDEIINELVEGSESQQDNTYIDVNNMSWEEIAAARDAWINGKKIELNDSALPPVRSKWA